MIPRKIIALRLKKIPVKRMITAAENKDVSRIFKCRTTGAANMHQMPVIKRIKIMTALRNFFSINSILLLQMEFEDSFDFLDRQRILLNTVT